MIRLSLSVKRLLAYFIDCVVAFVFFAVSQLTVFAFARRVLSIEDAAFQHGMFTEVYVLLTVSVFVWFYFAWFDSSRSKGTIGKRVFHLTVHHPPSNGKPSFSRSLSRTILKLLPWEISHLANNFPTPLMYDANPSFRFGFIITGALMLAYVTYLIATKGKQTLYDSFLATEVKTI